MSRTQLTELQLDLMRVLWEHGEATVAEVRDGIAERDLAVTTVATVLSRLEKQEVVSRRMEGRQYVYHAAVSEGQVRRSMVDELVGSLFDGDAAALVHHLVNESELEGVDLEGLRAMLDQNEKGSAQ